MQLNIEETFYYTTSTDIKLAVSGAPVTAEMSIVPVPTATSLHRRHSVYCHNSFEENRGSFTIPVGTPFQWVFRSYKPDIFFVALSMPGHELATVHGLVFAVLRQASYNKFQKANRPVKG